MDVEYVRSRFAKHFDGAVGSVYASPGRINLIGEHTDYNGGFVFPGAVDKGNHKEESKHHCNRQCIILCLFSHDIFKLIVISM
ncbi:Galactokinase [termite gut metagenome]|uniref:Galactokinase n=1 Tax=termite gut metagenome TaxID=433724 RepID=A0A5J4Q319_9ZZZZ